jgi:hypothetical protein
MFCLNLKKLGQLKGQEVHIILEDDIPIFRQPYRFIEVEKVFNTSLNNKVIGCWFGGIM